MILSARGLLQGMRDICQNNVNCRECPLNLYHCATPDDEVVDIVTSYVKSRLKAREISIDDVMSVFDDYMQGDVNEDDTNTFLTMLIDKTESEEDNDT